MSDFISAAHNLLAALQAAQRAYDNMEPECQPDPFLETEEGQKWLQETAEYLAEGGTLVINNRIICGFADVLDELRDTDEWCAYANACVAHALGKSDYRFQRRELDLMDLRKAAIEVAKTLVAPHAEEWEDDQKKMAEMFP